LQDLYKEVLNEYNQKGIKLTKVTAIELFSSYNNIKSEKDKPIFKFYNSVKTMGISLDESDGSNVYIPSKFNHHIPYPDLINNNETKLDRQSPFLPINPIKSKYN